MSHLEPCARAEVPGGGPVRIGRLLYVRAPEPIHFPSEEPPEEAVSETKRHLEARTTLYLLLKDALRGDALGSDQFVYYDATDPRRCLSPDVFVKRGSTEANFDVWKVWLRGAPELAVEIISASDHRDADWGEKMRRYRASGIGEVVRFDAADREAPVRVWDRIDGDLIERVREGGQPFECLTLGLWWVVTPSEMGPQLRLARDPEGKDLLPTPDEERLRLARELADERSARTLAEHNHLVESHAREAEAKAREAEAKAREAEAKARAAAERERDAALAELEALRAQLATKG